MHPGNPLVGETFRRWSQDLLAALSGADPALHGTLERLLIQRFEQQVRDLAGELRQELPAWQETARHLEHLADSPLLPLPEGVRLLSEAVRQRACQAGSLLAALESLARPPRLPPAEPANANVEVPAPAVEETPAREPPAPKPKGETLLVVCPECGAEGKVRWDRLGHLLACRGCKRYFRVDAGGRLTEMMRQGDGRWLVRSAARAGRYRLSLAVSVGILLVVLVTGLGWRQRQARARVPELPGGLQERAELLARAWLQRDVPLMRRLTVTTQDRVLYSWFVRHQPPVSGAGPPEVKLLAQQNGLTPVEIRVPGGRAGQPPISLRLFWERRGDTWFFVPPSP